MTSSQFTINNPSPLSQLRSPRGFVLINGQSLPWETFEVTNTRYASAGTFRVTIPASSLSKAFSLTTLLNTVPLVVQVNAGIPAQVVANNATPSDVPMLIQGNTDEVIYSPDSTLITISGRDYTALFMDNKIGQSNVSPSPTAPLDLESLLGGVYSSNIVSQLATMNGLTPVVTQTKTAVGKYFQSSYSLLSSQITQWDLMTFLARLEGFDLFVLGKNVYFQPKSKAKPYQITIAVPYYTTNSGLPISNVMSIKFTRNYRLAKDIVVNVSSWNLKDKLTYTAVATLDHTETLPEGTQVYNYTFPNLKQDQVIQKASTLLQQISQHEMNVDIQMPADTILQSNSIIAVQGTNTIFDQQYYVTHVTREMSFGGGFIMTIQAKSQSPYTAQVTGGGDT